MDGKDTDGHVRVIEATFQMIKEKDLTLNKKKLDFNKPSIKFSGLVFLLNGIYPDLEKVTSSEKTDVPKNKNELRLFLGMTNFSSIFIENHFSITAELIKLLYKHTNLEWNDKHQI